MNLFDKVPKGGNEVAGYSEPSFSYINRSTRKEFTKIRALLEEWFDHYPRSGKQELRNRFRSKNDIHHQAAFFELFLHELLLRLECKLELHPKLDRTTKVPDFIVDSPSNEKFYLEATVVTGESAKIQAARTRENIVYDVLDRLVKSPDYFLTLSVKGSPDTPPPAKKLASYINSQLKLLDYDEISSIYISRNFHNLPRWYFEHNGWRIEIRPAPKFKLRGREGVRPIGTRIAGFTWIDNRIPIRDSIIEKGRKYGELDLPVVIAVNALDHVDETDILEALYGKEKYIINISDDTTIVSEPRFTRTPDGVWTGRKGPRYTRISAVLIVTQLSTYNIPRSSLRLYHNPWAQIPYRSVLTQLHQAIPINGIIHMERGINTYAVFDLDRTWPENTN